MEITNNLIQSYLQCKHKSTKNVNLNFGANSFEKQNEIIVKKRFNNYFILKNPN